MTLHPGLRSHAPTSSPFSSNLRFLRKRHGLNQDDISGLFNKRANTVGNWENGKAEPSIPELLVIAGYFGVNLDDLLRSELRRGQEESERQLNLWHDGSEKRSSTAVIRPMRPLSVRSGVTDPSFAGESSSLSEHKPAATGREKLALTKDIHQDPAPADPVSFLLRELRAVKERLDRLQANVDQAGYCGYADKSDH